MDSKVIAKNVRRFRYAAALAVLAAVPCYGQSADTTANTLVGGLQHIVNDKTPIGVTDGNPQAATAVLSGDAFERFGTTPLIGAGKSSGVPVDFSLGGGSVNTGGYSTYYVSGGAGVGFHFTDKVGMVLSVPLEYRESGGKDAYIGGLNLGLAFTVIPDTDLEHGWAWQISPWLNAGFAGSWQLAQGGFMYGGGVTSSIVLHLNKQLSLIWADQAGWEGGTPIGYGDRFNFEQNVHQPIIKNGGVINYDITEKIFVDAGTNYTNLLDGGFTDNYWTVTGGGGYHFTQDCGMRLNFVGYYANRYSSNGAEVLFYFNF